jgi:hypothetical protein
LAIAVLLSSFAGALVVPAVAGAAQTYFHIHSDAYSSSHNCSNWEWSSSYGVCLAGTGTTPAPGPFGRGDIIIRWCTAATNCTDVGNKQLTLPSGYSRWMLVCKREGQYECNQNWLVGAVRTPNGPFTVMEGKYGNRTVKPSSPTGAVEGHGGPLFLFVGYWGRVHLGSGNYAHGYVFGLRGHLDVA